MKLYHSTLNPRNIIRQRGKHFMAEINFSTTKKTSFGRKNGKVYSFRLKNVIRCSAKKKKEKKK